MARLTALYDVTNDLIVDVQFTGISIGEREHAHRLLSSGTLANDRNYKNLIIFDRGYPSRALIHELEDKGLSYLIRCSHSFLSCVNGCPDGDHTVTDIYKGRTTQIRVIKDTSGEAPIYLSAIFLKSVKMLHTIKTCTTEDGKSKRNTASLKLKCG